MSFCDWRTILTVLAPTCKAFNRLKHTAWLFRTLDFTVLSCGEDLSDFKKLFSIAGAHLRRLVCHYIQLSTQAKRLTLYQLVGTCRTTPVQLWVFQVPNY